MCLLTIWLLVLVTALSQAQNQNPVPIKGNTPPAKSWSSALSRVLLSRAMHSKGFIHIPGKKNHPVPRWNNVLPALCVIEKRSLQTSKVNRINLSSFNFNLNFYIHLDINLKMSKTKNIDSLPTSPCCPICLHLTLSHLSKWHCHWRGGSSQKTREPPSLQCQSSHHDRSPQQFHTTLTGPPAYTLTKYSLLSVLLSESSFIKNNQISSPC